MLGVPNYPSKVIILPKSTTLHLLLKGKLPSACVSQIKTASQTIYNLFCTNHHLLTRLLHYIVTVSYINLLNNLQNGKRIILIDNHKYVWQFRSVKTIDNVIQN